MAKRSGTEWDRGWTGHERAQRRRLARLTLAEKLRWLEESQQVVDSLVRARHGRVDRSTWIEGGVLAAE